MRAISRSNRMDAPRGSSENPVRIGFIQLTDAAPIIVAAERGYFSRLGIHVELHRELGWASIHDRILFGEIDFAHSLGPIPLASSLGLNGLPIDCVGLSLLSRNGNSITLSNQFEEAGIKTAKDFATFVKSEKWHRHFIFGVVSPASSHRYLLSKWLQGIGLTPGQDVEIVNLPPGQFLRNIEARTIDGACVGAPWGLLATQKNVGVRIATSMDIAPNHPEKILIANRKLYESESDLCAKVIAATTIGGLFCEQDPATTADILSQENYLNQPSHQIFESIPSFTSGAASSNPLKTQDGIHFGTPSDFEVTPNDRLWFARCLKEAYPNAMNIPQNTKDLAAFYPSTKSIALPYIQKIQSVLV